MDLGIAGKTAVVGGSSQGMGLAIAEGLAREGCNLLLCARNEAALEAARQRLLAVSEADKIATLSVDLSLTDSAHRIVTAATEKWGGVDILVTNTGGPKPGQPSEFSDQDWDEAYQKVFYNVIRLCREVLPGMRERRWGRIINLLALSVRQIEDNLSLSSTTRAAVVAFSKNLAEEVAAEGITINNVLPGSIHTERLEEVSRMQAQHHGEDPDQAIAARVSRIPTGRLGRPEEMADLVAFLASERAGFINGLSIPLEGGQLRSVI
ncbi:MAG: SDR family oxidoreductase [Gammaproteobacteria bacterium]